MQEQRRSFLKKAAGASAVVAASGLMASTKVEQISGGVVVGRSKKKEILYRETPEWNLYYKRSY
ncbi:MAG: twin-arginine translocation signal domain-containing protein [Sulfurospirillaceae bacterium]|nr:twin-arginine translocation signal domain-containing protein [Sulfurospirillaceae bacterium]MCK9546336.1 twin-arginine translocation signal domain-containing protein [Sulfurospirillaceae bacterium]MDY0238441.1 twin-arginine translocation signal domain-containing protein [Campylobacterales bacterium]NLM98911.1 twin-arginine translocation signal domain-containing protein [Campylobacteraceae bacterium]